MLDREMEHEWHVAINRFHDGVPIGQWRHWMYQAKSAAYEVRRLTLLHAAERKGKLRTIHRQCSLSAPEPVVDNHLTCCLGVECRKCPELAAIDAAKLTDEQKDEAKAWTCVGHILMSGGDCAGEGYILTVDDLMFWERTYANMRADLPEQSDAGDESRREG